MSCDSAKAEDCPLHAIAFKRNLKRKHSGADGDEDQDQQVTSSKVVYIDSRSPNFVAHIPDEIILKIFKYLNGNDLYSLSKVCRRFSILVKEPLLWQNVDLSDKPLRLKEIKSILTYINDKTKSICFKGMVSTYPLRNWDKVTLSRIMMKQIKNTSKNLHSFELREGFINLEKMGMGDFPKSIETLQFYNVKLKKLTEIQSIFVNMDQHFENLSTLNIEYCSFLRPYDLMVISKFPNLKHLSVRGSSSFHHMVPYCSVAARLGFKKLKYLDLSDTPIHDSDLQCFNAVKTLTTLILGCVKKPRDHLIDTDEKVEVKKPVNEFSREVIVLQLREGDPVVQRLPPSPEVCSRFYQPFINPPQQDIELNISDRSICTFGVAPFHPPGFIRIINDAIQLNTKNNLEKLVVKNYKKITNFSLDHLGQCASSLVHLDVSGTGVTADGIERFRLKNPKCFIVY